MTKLDILDQIEFALSELADVQIKLTRIQQCPIEQPRPGQFSGETVAFTLGRCQEMASQAEVLLRLAIGNLRDCLTDPKKPIAPFTASMRTTHPNPASQPNSNADELYEKGLKILKGDPA